jgi:integrase
VRDGRLHDARHTAATVLLLLGVHERTIMSVLGWSTTAMVSRYAHVIAPVQSDLATRLNQLLWSSHDSPPNSSPHVLDSAISPCEESSSPSGGLPSDATERSDLW